MKIEVISKNVLSRLQKTNLLSGNDVGPNGAKHLGWTYGNGTESATMFDFWHLKGDPSNIVGRTQRGTYNRFKRGDVTRPASTADFFAVNKKFQLGFKTNPVIDLEHLRQLAIRSEKAIKHGGGPKKFFRTTAQIERDSKIRAYVIARANGRCEGCGKKPELSISGLPLLESHHFEKGGIAKGGRDAIRSVAALDGGCHNIGDRGIRRDQFNKDLKKKIRQLEAA